MMLHYECHFSRFLTFLASMLTLFLFNFFLRWGRVGGLDIVASSSLFRSFFSSFLLHITVCAGILAFVEGVA